MARAVMRSDRVSVQDLISVLCDARRAVAVRERATVRRALAHAGAAGRRADQQSASL